MPVLKSVLPNKPIPYNKAVMVFSQILLATPLVIFTLDYSLANMMLALISLSGIFLFFYQRQWRKLDFKDWLFHPIVLTLVFMVTIYIAAFSQGAWGAADTRKLEDMTWALLLLGLIPVNRRWGSSDTFWWGMIGCAVLSGGIALYEVYNHGLHLRVTGSKGKPIMFGDIAMMAGTFSVLAIYHFKKRGLFLAFIASMAALLGVFASIQSGTRGAWIFVPVFAVILLVFLLNKNNNLKWLPIFILIPITVLYGLAQTPTVSTRINQAVEEVNNYISEKPGSTESSIGQRFEMWRSGLEIFMEHPVTGVGISQLNNHYKEYVKRGESPLLAIRDHAHNEYLNTLISRGVLGFNGLMILLIGCGYFFYRHFYRNPTVALAGITLLAAYATFGLTDSIFFFKFSWIFFFSCLYLLSDALFSDQAV